MLQQIEAAKNRETTTKHWSVNTIIIIMQSRYERGSNAINDVVIEKQLEFFQKMRYVKKNQKHKKFVQGLSARFNLSRCWRFCFVFYRERVQFDFKHFNALQEMTKSDRKYT